jgi:hypothetical protein
MPNFIQGILTAGGRTYATWSTVNKSSLLSLSSNNLTVSSGLTFGSVISNIGVSPGDTCYFEIKPTIAGLPETGGPFMGMGTFIPPSTASTQQVGTISSSFAFRSNSNAGITQCILIRRATGSTTYVGINACTISLAVPGIVTVPNHNYYTGMAFKLTTTGTLPIPLVTNTNYYVHVIDNNTFYLASNLANSVAGPYINVLTGYTGVPNVNPVGTCTVDVATGDVFSFAINNATGKANIYRNGELNSQPTGTDAGVFINFYVPLGSTWYPCVSGDGNGSTVTANFGQNAWDIRTLTLRNTLESAGYKIGVYI